MFNLFFEESAIFSIKNFIKSYKNIFIKMIIDSWLEVEEYLINNYIEIWDKLYQTIISEIKNNFKQDILLWRTINKSSDNYLVININNFRLFVYYKENIDLEERYITEIEFFKK